ncbi:MAG: alpha/beta fold hydrolase [Eubacteriales bacterium]
MRCSIMGIDTYYEVIGEGKPILMLHGYHMDHRLMLGCMEPVFQNKKGWQRIYLDLPGMGQTQGSSIIKNADDILNFLLNFIDFITPNKNILIAGQSYGGYLARGVVYKRSHSVKGLFLLCPVIIPQKNKRVLPSHSIFIQDTALLKELEEQEKQEVVKALVILNNRNYMRYKGEVKAGKDIAQKSFLKNIKNQGYGFTFDVDHLISPFENPTTILTGRQDDVVGYEDAMRITHNFSKGTYVAMDGAGHMLHIEKEIFFNVMVEDWCAKVSQFLD